MAHYITVPINENGIIFDASMNDVVAEAMAVSPFAFKDVYIYSHGWSVNADNAVDTYNKFSVDLARLLLIGRLQTPHLFAYPPQDALGIGIHWPSDITEDPASLLNVVQLFTFYSMQHRADAVGKNAVYMMLRLMLRERFGTDLPLRVFMVGHSFGCKVVLAALQDLKTDIDGGTIAVPPGTEFHVALLQAATDHDNLEPGDIYGSVPALVDRLLMTTSSLDEALGTWFPAAGKLANLLHAPPQALGSVGPTVATCNAFGAAGRISVIPGLRSPALSGITAKLVIADLSPVHQARVNSGAYTGGGVAGSHSDISFAEVYELICGFFYQAV